MSTIQTVLGPIPAADFGVCYAHEHLLGAPPSASDSDFVLDDEEAAAEELIRFRRAGGSAVVEMSTADYGRDAEGLRRLSERTGVHILCATGYNKDDFCAPLVRDASVETLADRFVRELCDGIEPPAAGTARSRHGAKPRREVAGTASRRDSAGTPPRRPEPVRAGLVKASSTLDRISPLAERVFRAAAAAHRRTGAPLSTHTEAGTMALEQIRLLESEGVDPRRVVIGHMDRRLDLTYHQDVASTGAFLGFDQISKEKYSPDRDRAEVIARLVDEGFGDRILLGGDLARRSYWSSFGGAPGFGYILERFVPLLGEVGLGASAIDDLLIHNPARAFSFTVAQSPPSSP